MHGRGGTADDSWEIWWAEENESTFKRRWDQRFASCGKGLLLLAVAYNLVTTELWELWSCDETSHMKDRAVRRGGEGEGEGGGGGWG